MLERKFFGPAVGAMFGAFLVLSAGTAKADIIAVTAVNGAPLNTSGGDEVLGWVFSANAAINVTALGVYELGNAVPGLAISHDVGIYNQNTQSLLTSTAVPSGSCALSAVGFCFTALSSPVLLTPGNYVIVMTMPASNADRVRLDGSSVVTASEIAWITSAIDAGSSLHFPDPVFNGIHDVGLFGPNFEFQAATVPEPRALLLLGGALCAIFGARRRGWILPARQ